MTARLYVPLYSITLLLSASLLFVVQPMFSKMILPLLGGTPQVWNTAMLFFQLLLLAGYAYAHGTTRFLSVRIQAVLHVFLLGVFAFVLPIMIPEGWAPPANSDPTFWQLSLMVMTVGGPFFILSASAPLLQRWFTYTGHEDAENPYFLYGASNLGSMTALLAYPVLIEPLMDLSAQSQSWMYGYFVLAALVVISALVIWRHGSAKDKSAKQTLKSEEHITWARRGKWLLLAFIPSSLMLGITTYITTDVASVPLLWIIPLALYVSTFIIVFARKPIIPQRTIMIIFGFLMIALLVQSITIDTRAILLILFHMIVFFFAALACHTELAQSRPHASRLTEFYLLMSLGGALGGIFNAIVAPNIFVMPLEYPLVLGLAACMRFTSGQKEKIERIYVIAAFAAVVAGLIAFNINSEAVRQIMAFIVLAALAINIDKRWSFGVPVILILLMFPPGHIWGQFMFRDVLHQNRSFFGVVKVVETENDQHLLMHGTTNHGTQSIEDAHEFTPLSYYHYSSPISDLFKSLDVRAGDDKQEVAVLGLGVGVTACYKGKNRHFDFFEIDPDIVEIAENPEYFTFLSGCGSPYEVIVGDARLTLANKPDGYYDFIMADAYSSDNIPVHLITLEAIELYLQKLKPNGVLGFNISNNYIDVEPVLFQAAQALNLKGYAKLSMPGKLEGTDIEYNAAHAFSFARTPAQEKFLQDHGWTPARDREGVSLWTDRFSNIISVIGNKTGKERIVEIMKAEKAQKKDKEAKNKKQ